VARAGEAAADDVRTQRRYDRRDPEALEGNVIDLERHELRVVEVAGHKQPDASDQGLETILDGRPSYIRPVPIRCLMATPHALSRIDRRP
jgi:hypothetical protein